MINPSTVVPRANPLRKARSILRKSGRPAAVAFLKSEVEEMAEVSPEMAEGIASDALDGNEEILLAILQLVEDLLDGDGVPDEEESPMGDEGPLGDEAPIEDEGGLPPEAMPGEDDSLGLPPDDVAGGGQPGMES